MARLRLYSAFRIASSTLLVCRLELLEVVIGSPHHQICVPDRCVLMQ